MVKEEQMKKEIESIDTKNTDEEIVIKGSKTYLFFKRVLDIVVSFISIVFLMATLIFPIISLLVLISTHGQVIFKDERMGLNKKKIRIYKFQTMFSDAETNLDKYLDENQKKKWQKERKLDDDPRVTKLGKFLRKTSLDELPQLFNILKGEMSFIGPRPWIVDYAKYFTRHQMRRLEVLPGITGLAQCSGRNNLGIIERIDIDVEYVENMSLFLDVYIVLKTIKSVLKKEGFSNSKLAIHDELNILKNQSRSPNRKKNKNSVISNVRSKVYI